MMTTVISFHVLHDANVSVCCGGQLLAVLELERLFGVRYFCSDTSKTKFTHQWKHAINTITNFVGIKIFDVAVTSWVMPSQKKVLQSLVDAKRWEAVDHHVSHAALGFYDSPFNKALILSYDGGGNDGTFLIFEGNKNDPEPIKCLEKVKLNLGGPYRQIATAMSEVTGQPFDLESVSTYIARAPLNLSGKVMGYAALGSVRDDWIPAVRDLYEYFMGDVLISSIFQLGQRLGLCLEANALEFKDARDLAATSQFVFGQFVCEQVDRYISDSFEKSWDGIVLTGGCALNVHTNQLIAEKYGLPIHVPCAPNDCGISTGAAWVIQPPKELPKVQYLGLPCFDFDQLLPLVEERRAERVTTEQVADLLLAGAVIGVVRGRQEFGPRALGHRSMLAYPDKTALKDKLNKLKGREWFRPLCPSVAVESVPKLFKSQLELKNKGDSEMKSQCENLCIQLGEDFDWIPSSPYMSFSPYMTELGREKFPAICHYDHTARLQTVRASDDDWYHSLLTEIANRNGGYGILLNTSFNVKGKPILNRLSDALSILDSSLDDCFDFVLIEDWLFRRNKTE